MYKSPVEIMLGEMQTQIEGEIFRAVQNYDIKVDKEELIRALHYDREQYNKGFRDAMEKYRWIPVTERMPKNFVSVLGYMTDAGAFPPVRECYTIPGANGDVFFFPALLGAHPVSHWCEMPEPPKGE